MIFLRSIAIWFIFIALESLNGTVRTFITGSLLILTIATISICWLNPDSLAQTIGVGVLWMLLTATFEVGLGRWALGYSWAQIAGDYNLFQDRLMGLGLVLLLLAPLIAIKIRDFLEELTDNAKI
jgi:hypothetical protein